MKGKKNDCWCENRLENRDFYVLDGFDHTHRAIGARTWKLMRFHAKLVRDRTKSQKSTPSSVIYLVLILKIMSRIVIFRKILDGEPTKITKMSRKIDLLDVIAEKPWFFTFWTALMTRKVQLVAGPEKSWFLMRKSFGSLKITKIQHLFPPLT